MTAGAVPFLDADSIGATLGWTSAVHAIERFLLEGPDPADALDRTIVELSHGQLLMMPAESAEAVGVKIASLSPGNPGRGMPRIQGLYLLLDRETHRPRAVMDGSALTFLRTPAVSGVAAAHLALPEAQHLVVFGSGPQARGHIEVLRRVRPLRSVTVVSRDLARAASLVAWVNSQGDESQALRAQLGDASATPEADIVVCATASGAPLFDGRDLSQEACVIAVGSHEPNRREVDSDVVHQAAAGAGVVVETRSAALREAGDIVLALKEQACTENDLVELRDLVRRTSRTSGISLFKSCGMGWQDLVIAEAVHASWDSNHD